MDTLVKRAQLGDAEAFISLMEECRMSFRRVAFGYLGKDNDVIDMRIEETYTMIRNVEKRAKKKAQGERNTGRASVSGLRARRRS